MSIFLRELNEYERSIDVVGGYFQQTKLYLKLLAQHTVDDERIANWLRKQFLPGGRFELKPPKVNIGLRDPATGDRRAATTDMLKLLKLVRSEQLIMSPSMTIYTPPHVKRSLISMFIDENIERRGAVKKEMFAAQAAKNEVLARNKEKEQTNLKLRNNALSGAHCSPFTILFNKSTHSSLTSTCRSATSYGNANNEKVLGGTRHYWAPGIVVNNILATITITDFEEFETCVKTYNLHIPTVEETMACIRYSTDLFWKNEWGINDIEELVKTIKPIERAAFVYIGDLYHVAKYNDKLMRDLLGEFITKVEEPLEDYEAVKKSIDGDTNVLLSLLYADRIVSGDIKSLERTKPNDFKVVMGGAKRLYDNINKWLPFFRSLLYTKNVPASIARLPDTIRRVALTSDTDSTMGSTQWWADWYCGEDSNGPIANAVADTMTYFAVQNIAHMMARMSANIGVERKQTFTYSMKNEYKFDTFTLTSKAKHYFSVISSREGTLYDDPELEVKGVALRNSNIPPIIMKEFKSMIRNISIDVMEGRKIKLFNILTRLAEIEDHIIDTVHKGDFTYLKTSSIKTEAGYAKPESSSHIYYRMWDYVFAPKYGYSGEPPFNVVKLSVDLHNKTKVKRWLAGLKDQALAKRMQEFLDKKSGGKTFTHILIPEFICAAKGIPSELLEIADYRKIIYSSVEPYYHVLEALGVYMIDTERTRLVSDYYGKLANAGSLAAA